MAERSVTHPSNYGEWDDDIVLAAIRAAGEVVAEGIREASSYGHSVNPSNADEVGLTIGKVARAILNEMGRAN